MKKYGSCLLICVSLFLINADLAKADNPFIQHLFTADPTARVFDGKIFVYPSHDIPYSPGKGRENWFIMEDYHTFSSENLMDWTDHGVILDQKDVPWLNRQSYDMWAPDCVYKNGTYYFYFPTGGRIGVATSDKPEGPFKSLENPVQGARGIDPCVLMLDDGSAYLYSSQGGIFVGKLKDNMIELEGQQTGINLPRRGLIEGPFAFERNGKIYLTYPHVQNEVERLEYAMSDNPMGPFEHKGVIMDESPTGCWTNHHSLVEYKDQWYLFYHHNDLSPDFDKNRAIRADYVTFNEDGTIQKVIPTLRGVGICDAKREIQIDRYSKLSDEGASIDFIDSENTFGGWKTILASEGAWVKYDRVDFGSGDLSSVSVRAKSAGGATIEIGAADAEGPAVTVVIPESTGWAVVNSKLSEKISGMQDLVVKLKDAKNVEIDWVSFK